MARRFATVGVALFVALVWLGWHPRVARAEGGSVGIDVTGPGAAKLKKSIVKKLPDGLKPDTLGAGEKKAGKALAKAKGKKRSKAVGALGKAGEKAGHDAVVIATVKKKKVTIVVVDVSSGDTLLDETVSLGDAPDKVAEALGPVAARNAPAPEPEPEIATGGEGEGEGGGGGEGGGEGEGGGSGEGGGEGEGGGGGEGGGEEPSVSASSGTAQGPMVVVGGGLMLGGRSLSYGGTTAGNLGDYSLFGAALFDLDLVLTPLPKAKGMLGRAGLTFGFQQSVGLNSANEGGADLPTTWREWSVGARLRFGGMDKHVAAALAYGISSFTIDAPNDGKLYPSAEYGWLRIGGDGRMPIAMKGKLSLTGGAGIRLVLGLAGLSDGFADPSAFGFDLGVGVAYKLGKALEARGGFDLAMYSYSMSPGAMFSADSATDTMYGFGAGVAYSY